MREVKENKNNEKKDTLFDVLLKESKKKEGK